MKRLSTINETPSEMVISESSRWEWYRNRFHEQAVILSKELELEIQESRKLLCRIFGLKSWAYLQNSLNRLEAAERLYTNDQESYMRLLFSVIAKQNLQLCDSRLAKGLEFNSIFEEQIDVLNSAMDDYPFAPVDHSGPAGKCQKIENYIFVYLTFLTFKTNTWDTPFSESWLTLVHEFYQNMSFAIDKEYDGTTFFNEERFRIFAKLFGPEPDDKLILLFKERVFNFDTHYTGNFGIHDTDFMPTEHASCRRTTLPVKEVREKLRYCNPNHVEGISTIVGLLSDDDVMEITVGQSTYGPRHLRIDVTDIYIKDDERAPFLSLINDNVLTEVTAIPDKGTTEMNENVSN